jgi:tRNA threonylcarbamoyladenosine biosynthesis protein TsaE
MPNEQTFSSSSVNDLDSVARGIIEFALSNEIWLFLGEMGAGKTTTIKAICKELGVIDQVQSPTFSIVNEYLTKKDETVYHFDFYRIESIEEVLNIGIEEYFDSGNLCLIEWPENIESILPEQFVRIDIQENEDRIRSFKLSKHG